MFQDSVARDGPVRIETSGLLFLFLHEKEEVERPGSKQDRDGDTDVRAEGRSFLAGDSAPLHQIAITLLKQRLATSVTYFSQTEGRTDMVHNENSRDVRIAQRDVPNQKSRSIPGN